MNKSNLVVLVDGIALPDEEARALWGRFSAWMDDRRGDLAGFAAREGFASVPPVVDAGRPVLRASRTEMQQPYAPVAQSKGTNGGSATVHKRPPRDRSGRRNSKK